jgi:hypothetical protein
MITLTVSSKLVRDLQFKAMGITCSDFANGCEHPLTIALRGLPDKIMHGFAGERLTPTFHTVTAPCRRCKTCLRNRSRRWAAKAHTECVAASRTWFCTLTFSPRIRFKHKLEAQHRATERGHRWREMSSAERFAYIHHECAKDCTKWIKRIRKNSGAPLRYLLVVEAHKDGFPHYHALLHEAGHEISWRTLTSAWRSGYSNIKLADDTDRAPWYVCKYIAKSALSRVRASQKYGPVFGRIKLTELVLEATRPILMGRLSPSLSKEDTDLIIQNTSILN